MACPIVCMVIPRQPWTHGCYRFLYCSAVETSRHVKTGSSEREERHLSRDGGPKRTEGNGFNEQAVCGGALDCLDSYGEDKKAQAARKTAPCLRRLAFSLVRYYICMKSDFRGSGELHSQQFPLAVSTLCQVDRQLARLNRPGNRIGPCRSCCHCSP